ncbi:hypothetical protein [Bradyrhizobium icense]|uniref:hypothetical protein n=1 Tax=Bradyrhizobium icense TaxID=1274631 RepID=UPI0012EAA609|nr:hypothetical protein [Bradyrhizobium icense]
MAAFLVGLAVAVVVAVGNVVALNAFDKSTSQAFYTRYTLPLDYTTPTDGRLDVHK